MRKLTIYNDTKIFVHAPSGWVTGGVELLHQIVNYLRINGKDAYITYHGESEHKVPSDYLVYNIEVADNVDDNEHNIEVFPETMFDVLCNSKRKTQVLFWWLSVDNFFNSLGQFDIKTISLFNKKEGRTFLKDRLKALLYRRNEFSNKLSFSYLIKNDIICGYQCEYIFDFLSKNGIKSLVPLYDYINTDHIVEISGLEKDDIVLYNPNKGFDYTKQLISLAPEIQWVELKGYSRTDLINIIRKAKLYIDFGNHPGKDRLPRECAMNGCCIITGLRGAAKFDKDIPIHSKYKFDELKVDKKDIVDAIREILANYETAIDDFKLYRNRISEEKVEFERQIENIFQL